MPIQFPTILGISLLGLYKNKAQNPKCSTSYLMGVQFVPKVSFLETHYSAMSPHFTDLEQNANSISYNNLDLAPRALQESATKS